MPAIILQNPNAVQFDYIIEYAKRENVQFEVSDSKRKTYPLLPPVTLTDKEMKRIEESINSGRGSLDELKQILAQ